ncbi:hypothetical protein G6F22_016351 [Rhizopus arrhizus]|nr:hypothetical protein G6F22_016351 [Rhizopus arrhizus]
MDAQALRHHRQRRLHTPVDFAVPVAGRGRRRRAAAVLPVFWRVPHRTGLGQDRISAFRAACRGAGPGAGAVLHLRVQCARHALICAVRQRGADRPVQLLPLSHARVPDDDDGDARGAASPGGSRELPGRRHGAGAARCGPAADRAHRAGRVLLPVHAVDGDAVGGDIPGDAHRQRGAGIGAAVGRGRVRFAGRGVFHAYHAGRWRLSAGHARVDRRCGAAAEID